MYGAALSRGFGFADCARRLLRVLGARRLPRVLGAIACNKSESTVYLAVLCPRATPSGGLFNTCIRRMTRLFASSVHDASPLDFLHSTKFLDGAYVTSVFIKIAILAPETTIGSAQSTGSALDV